MTTMTTYDNRMADYRTRTAHVNQHAWMRPSSQAAGINLPARVARDLRTLRQEIGTAVIHAGERLQGLPAGNTTKRAAV